MTTVGDQLKQFGGVPVDSGGINNWPGYWGTNVWFVDGDDGYNGNSGTSPTAAYSTVSNAISSASAGDTIYVKPRVPTSDASDPEVYAEELTIPYGKNSMSIIGTRRGHDNFYGPKLKLGTADAVVDVYAPAFTIENFTIHRRSSNTKAVYLRGITGYGSMAGSVGSHISNCMIRYGSPHGIYIEWGYHSNVNNCTFWGNDIGCYITGQSVPQRGMGVHGCNFYGANGTVAAGPDIRILGASTELTIDRCLFDAVPTSTTYIVATGTVDGKITDCHFAAGTTDINAAAAAGEIQVGSGSLSIAGCTDGTGTLVVQA
jgi:hypothetical protein